MYECVRHTFFALMYIVQEWKNKIKCKKTKKKLGTYFEYRKSIRTQETFVKEIGINKALKRWHFAIKIKIQKA